VSQSGTWNVVTHDWDWIWDQTLTLTSSNGHVSTYGTYVPGDWADWGVFYQDEVQYQEFEVKKRASK
jgi:hypothetical protein